MASGRLASAKLTANTPSLLYTVPTNNVSSVNVVARNFGTGTSNVTLLHTANASAPTVTSVDSTTFTKSKTNVPYKTFPENTGTYQQGLPPTYYVGTVPYSNSTKPLIFLNNASFGHATYGPWAFLNLDTGASELTTNYINAKGGNTYNTTNGQIAPFFQNNDYWSVDGNGYPFRLKGKLTDKTAWTNTYNGTDSYGYTGSQNTSYYDYGFAGFRRMAVSAGSNGYIHVFYNCGEGSSGTVSNYTSNAQSFYNVAAAYATFNQYSLSVVPYTDSNGNIVSYHFVASGYNGSECRIGWKDYSDDGSTVTANMTYITLSGVFTGNATIAWFRKIGSYVYAMTTNNECVRAPANSWKVAGNWTNITASLPAGTSYLIPWIDDGYGNALAFTTAGVQRSNANGTTWSDIVTTTTPSYITSSGITMPSDAFYYAQKNDGVGKSYHVFAQNDLYEFTTVSVNSIGTVGGEDIFEKNLPLDPAAVVEHKGLVLNAGDKVYAVATNSDTVVQVYGFEEGI